MNLYIYIYIYSLAVLIEKQICSSVDDFSGLPYPCLSAMVQAFIWLMLVIFALSCKLVG